MDENVKDTPETEEIAEDVSGEEENTSEEQAEQTSQSEEYTALYDKYLRTLAEFENYKRRTQKEKDDIYAMAKTDVVSKLLPVIDNFDRAESVIDDETVREGVRLIRKQFDEFLAKLGVLEIDAKGKEFDPNFHSAVLHEDVEGEPENTVSEVLQKGYMLGEKVIRHAIVKVVN